MEKAAARVLLPRFRTLSEHDCEEKSAGEVVTIADRESEAMLANNLGTVYLSLGLYGQARAYALRAVRTASR